MTATDSPKKIVKSARKPKESTAEIMQIQEDQNRDQSSDQTQVKKAQAVKEVPIVPLKNGANGNGNSNGNGNANGGSKDTDASSKNSNSNLNSNLNLSDKDSNSNSNSKDSDNSNQTLNQTRKEQPLPERKMKTIRGVLDLSRDGHGVVRVNYSQDDEDAYISTSQIRRMKLRPGDIVEGPVREPKENERYWGMVKVDSVNGVAPNEFNTERIKFYNLTPVHPDEQIKLETGEEPLSLRIIDMIAPIGKGQRSLIVSPPKAGKTSLLKDMATGIAANHPEIHLMAVLVGERPEEVTDIRRHIHALTKGVGEVAASNFDEPADEQCRVAELALERAKRLVESGRDVLILLDSITRLARAYNLAIPTSGRTLSGGFDPAALFPPKKFFGAARNFEVPGSLTIIGTALVDTGSRMDDLVYEEFKGTGNQEVHLDRYMAERRIYPAIDVQRSGTRRDDLLIDPVTYQSVVTLHRMLDTLDRDDRTNTLIAQLKRTKSNKEFLASLKAG
jgi:transcription termination factor Rho